jgi:hypothetical protein
MRALPLILSAIAALACSSGAVPSRPDAAVDAVDMAGSGDGDGTPKSPSSDAGLRSPPIDAAPSAVPADAAPPAPDVGDSASSPDVAPATAKFSCTIVLGVSVTYDWFTSGFETYVDDARWEAMAPSQPLMAFIEVWADPNGAVWKLPKISPCASNAATPDRVIFTGVNWQYTTAAQWVSQLDAVVKVLQMKFPGVKEIDLMTMLRAPNNMSCGSAETVVQPFIDEAVQTVAAKSPALVRVAPRFFAPSCAVFTGGGPHFTAAGKMAIAKLYGEHYASE